MTELMIYGAIALITIAALTGHLWKPLFVSVYFALRVFGVMVILALIYGFFHNQYFYCEFGWTPAHKWHYFQKDKLGLYSPYDKSFEERHYTCGPKSMK